MRNSFTFAFNCLTNCCSSGVWLSQILRVYTKGNMKKMIKRMSRSSTLRLPKTTFVARFDFSVLHEETHKDVKSGVQPTSHLRRPSPSPTYQETLLILLGAQESRKLRQARVRLRPRAEPSEGNKVTAQVWMSASCVARCSIYATFAVSSMYD